jgi:hypothetical protein
MIWDVFSMKDIFCGKTIIEGVLNVVDAQSAGFVHYLSTFARIPLPRCF